MSKIFIQIASYRDPELLPTIRDCISKAKNPDRLTFGICWQKDDTEKLDEFTNDNRFRIIDYHWSKSKGLCWARSQIQKLWKDEDYTLQLDSHHRFAQNWDQELIDMMKLTDSQKPILTSYAGMYRPSDNTILNIDPYKMVASNFTDSGTILFRPSTIEHYENLKAPIKARFVSGHYFFTIGAHCVDYKYDPNIYFAGDEISLSIRSFTLGYDLFHPHKTLVWHEYTREGRTKHWTDFNQENVKQKLIEQTWFEMDLSSKRRLRHMLQEEDNNIDLGEYGLGNVRSHSEYEDYAGINFKHRMLHEDTKKGLEPPVDYKKNWWQQSKLTKHSMYLKIPAIQNFDFIYIGIEDKMGNLLFREDMKDYKDSVFVRFECESDKIPHKYIVWKYGNNTWQDRYDFVL